MFVWRVTDSILAVRRWRWKLIEKVRHLPPRLTHLIVMSQKQKPEGEIQQVTSFPGRLLKTQQALLRRRFFCE